MSHFDGFTQRMLLKRPFVGDTGEYSAVHLHCLGLLGDRSL